MDVRKTFLPALLKGIALMRADRSGAQA